MSGRPAHVLAEDGLLAFEHAHVGCLDALVALLHVELNHLTLARRAIASCLDRSEVHEHVIATITGDEAVALVSVETFDGSNGHEPCPSLPFARRYRPTPAKCNTVGKRQARPRHTRDETLNLCARHVSTASRLAHVPAGLGSIRVTRQEIRGSVPPPWAKSSSPVTCPRVGWTPCAGTSSSSASGTSPTATGTCWPPSPTWTRSCACSPTRSTPR